jgi:hypothetical protein
MSEDLTRYDEEGKKIKILEIDREIVETRYGLFEQIGQQVGALADQKNAAYGNSFLRMGSIMKHIYPDGVKVDQYQDFITIARLMDKFCRIAADKEAFGENPWRDVAGYSILRSKK